MATTTSSQGRQALSPVTTNQKEVAASSSEAQKIFKAKDLAMEKDNLRNMLDSSERNCDALDCHQQEKEARIVREELQQGENGRRWSINS
ncbi:hypothetical protein Tco_1215895 [Tanacetum coccineum]